MKNVRGDAAFTQVLVTAAVYIDCLMTETRKLRGI